MQKVSQQLSKGDPEKAECHWNHEIESVSILYLCLSLCFFQVRLKGSFSGLPVSLSSRTWSNHILKIFYTKIEKLQKFKKIKYGTSQNKTLYAYWRKRGWLCESEDIAENFLIIVYVFIMNSYDYAVMMKMMYFKYISEN